MNERDAHRLERISEKLAHMKAQRQDILARDRRRQRNERNRQLTQIGTLAEKYFGFKDMHPVEFEKFVKALMSDEGMRKVVESVKNDLQGDKTTSP